MSGFRNNPTTTGTPANVPVGTVAVPNHSNGDLTALEGGPASTDSNGNETAPVSIYAKDGNDVTQGTQTDPAWSGSGSGSLIAILKKIVAGQTGTATVVQGAGASAGTFWRVGGDFTEQASLSAGSVNADLIPATDVSAYTYIVVQLSGTWTATLQMQVSNDNVNYPDVVAGITPQGIAGISTAPIVSLVSNHLYIFPVVSRYMRLRVTSYTSGTVNGVAEFHTSPSPLIQVGASSAQNGAWTVQPGNTQNTTPWLVSAGPPADLTLLASAAQTTTQTLADQANFAGKGIRVTLDVTVAGTGSITLEIDAKDPASGKYLALLTGAAVTTVSTNVYVIHPELTAAANSIAKDVLPHTWRVKVTANNANSITYSVGSSYLN